MRSSIHSDIFVKQWTSCNYFQTVQNYGWLKYKWTINHHINPFLISKQIDNHPTRNPQISIMNPKIELNYKIFRWLWLRNPIEMKFWSIWLQTRLLLLLKSLKNHHLIPKTFLGTLTLILRGKSEFLFYFYEFYKLF